MRVCIEEIAHALVIPNYEAWFKDTFGEEMGTRLAAAYKADLDRKEKWFPTLFASLSKQDGEVLVEDVREPRYTGAGSWCGRVLLGASKKDASFYRVGVQQVLHTGLDRLDDAGYFTLVEGAYRRLDCRALGLGPDSLAPPLPHPSTDRCGWGETFRQQRLSRECNRNIRKKRGRPTFRERSGYM
jgi:hypothetical protein